MNDLIVIWAIFGIFLIAYGISTEAMLYPHDTNRGIGAIGRLLTRAYLEALGEMQLEEMAGKSSIYCFINYGFLLHMEIKLKITLINKW